MRRTVWRMSRVMRRQRCNCGSVVQKSDIENGDEVYEESDLVSEEERKKDKDKMRRGNSRFLCSSPLSGLPHRVMDFISG